MRDQCRIQIRHYRHVGRYHRCAFGLRTRSVSTAAILVAMRCYGVRQWLVRVGAICVRFVGRGQVQCALVLYMHVRGRSGVEPVLVDCGRYSPGKREDEQLIGKVLYGRVWVKTNIDSRNLVAKYFFVCMGEKGNNYGIMG